MGVLLCLTAASLLAVQAEATAGAGPRPAATSTNEVKFDRRWLEPLFQADATRAAAERYRLDDWRGATDGFARALTKMARSSPERHPARYMLALARMNDGQWQSAGELFEDLHREYPLLAPYHAYHAARSRLKRGDTAGAIAWADKVPARTVPEAEAVLVKMDALAAERRWADLAGEAGRFLERFPNGPRRAEAMFRRADALEKLRQPADAAALYRRIWAEAPLEAWSARAAGRLDAIAAATPADAAALRTHTSGDWVTRGMVFFDRNQNQDAEAAFVTALAAPGVNRDLECKAKYHRAQSVWKQRQRPRAAPLFAEAEAACRATSDHDLLVKAMYQGARCRSNMGDKAGAAALYARIEAEHAQHSYADDARLRAAEIAADAGDDALVESLLKEIPSRYPSADNLGEALWRLAFRAIQTETWDRAHAWLDENLRRMTREDVWYAEGRALYWKGRVHEKQGARDEARRYYARAVREYPLSVYAMLALERMRETFPQDRAQLLRELRAPLAKKTTTTAEWEFAPRAVFGEPGFLRAVELARMGIGSDARRELANLGFSPPDSRDAARKAAAAGTLGDEREEIFWITAILLDRGRLWHVSHLIPRYTLTSYRLAYPAGRTEAEWRIAYPRAFAEIVTQQSKENGVPEALQYAIMREESTFDPRIESFANALGLTQMLVKTAQRFVPYRVTRDALFDPARNLQAGSRFLSFLLQHYGGAAPLAIAGYNAGEGAVDRWLKQRPDVELDVFLEMIPFDETRNYTKRVLASYAAYSWLYFPDRPVPQISFSLKGGISASRETAGRARDRGGRR